MFSKLWFLLVFVVWTVGCGSDKGLDSEAEVMDGDIDGVDYYVDEDYVGLWYFGLQDAYIDITNSGIGVVYRCSVLDGYKADIGYQVIVDHDEVVWSRYGREKVYFISEESDEYVLTSEFNSEYPLVSTVEIPDSCDNDALSIVSYSPTNSALGVESTFTVTFDYRLSSLNSAEIHVGFSAGFYSHLNHESIVLDSTGTGRETIVTSKRLAGLGDGYPYLINVGMIHSNRGLASDYKVIDITE